MTNTLNVNNSIVAIPIYINVNKNDDMVPDLRGGFELDGQPLEVAIWTRRTKDGTRTYHSFSITKPYKKGQKTEALVKAEKLYELNGTIEGSPDYQTTKSFDLLGDTYWAALWTEMEQEESDPEDITFRMELLSKPFPAKLTPKAADTAQDLKDRILERRKERELREQQEARDLQDATDDIP
jgi:hypothetical protein